MMSASEQLKSRLAVFRDLGVAIWPEREWVGEVGTDQRREVDIPGTVTGLVLPFSARDWCDIAMNEGPYYIGGCCGKMSALQDLVNEAFRSGGALQAYQLLEIGSYALGHDGLELFDPIDDETFAKAISAWKGGELDPWGKMGLLYSSLEPALKPTIIEQPDARPLKTVFDLVLVVSNTLRSMSILDLFGSDEDDQGQHASQRTLLQAKVLPLLRDLLSKLEDVDISFDGYGLISVRDGQMATNSLGLCLYGTEAEAQSLLDQASRRSPEVATWFVIRRVTIDLENGLQIH